MINSILNLRDPTVFTGSVSVALAEAPAMLASVIPVLDYGMVNAPKVLDLALMLTNSNA